MKWIQGYIWTVIMDAKPYVSFFLISLDETNSQLQKSMELLEK